MRARTIDDDTLGSGQAAVLAALIRRASRGPVRMADLARDTGFSRTRIRRCVAALGAKDLVARTDRGPVPLVYPVSVEPAGMTGERVYDTNEGPPCVNRTTPLPEPPLLGKDVGNAQR